MTPPALAGPSRRMNTSPLVRKEEQQYKPLQVTLAEIRSCDPFPLLRARPPYENSQLRPIILLLSYTLRLPASGNIAIP